MCCNATYGGLPIKPGVGASGEENCYWVYEYNWGVEVSLSILVSNDTAWQLNYKLLVAAFL